MIFMKHLFFEILKLSQCEKHTVRKMKTSVLMLFIGMCAGFADNAYPQEAKFSFHLTDMSIREIINEIEKNSDYVFVFADNTGTETSKKVSVKAEDFDVTQVLDNLFAGTQLTYRIIDRQVVVFRDKTKKEIVPEQAIMIQPLQPPVKIKISGKITDAQGEPLIGVNIIEIGTTNGSASDANGDYSIEVQPAATLQFSYVGYETTERNTGDQTVINVVMAEEQGLLSEVVVMGYGTIERRTLTSAVSNIKQENFLQGSASPLMSIQGKVSGLSVQSTNGSDPNANITLQLRGVNSVNADKGPLIVIDGVPGAEMNAVAKEDIETISVLKDASAAAIYGTRASGGVILITTKRPQAGKATVSFTSELSVETIKRQPDILSAQEYRDYGKTDRDLPGDRGYDYGSATDWYKEVTNKNPFSQRYVISAGGGTENARIGATVNVRNAKGLSISTDREELNGRVNSYFKFLDGKLELISNASYSEVNANLIDNEIFEKAMTLNPTYPLYSDDYASGYNMILNLSQMFNPVAEVKLKSNQLESTLLLANSTLKWNITDYWSVSALLAAKRTSAHQAQYRSAQHRISLENNVTGWGEQNYKRYIDKTADLTTNFDKDFAGHRINAVAGYSFQEFNGQGFWANNSNFPVDGVGVNQLSAGTYLSTGDAGMDSFKDVRTRLIAFFGRANYICKDRYLLTATLRYEGSSKFYQDQWGTFPGLSVGWRISSEDFMKNVSFVNDLKLRAGYGETGNAGFSSERAFRMFALDEWTFANNQWMRVYGLKHNQVQNMKWEVKKEFDVGLDFSLFDYALGGRIDWYKRQVDRLIYTIPVASPPNVHSSSETNAGNLENTGFELELNWNIINKGDWNYTTDLVAATNKTLLKSLGIDNAYMTLHMLPHPGSAGDAVRIEPGQEIGKFFVYRNAGYDENGMALIYNKAGEIVPYNSGTSDDKVHMGNAIPKLTLSWGHNVSYKNWDLNVYLRSWLGFDVFNVSEMYYGIQNTLSTGRNVLESAFEEHSHINRDNPRLLTDYWVEKGDFMKIDVVTLGYTFRRIKPLNHLRVYLTGRDLLTITGYKGLDPEVNVNGLDPGFEDVNAYPRTRTFMLGLQVGF
jgi:TonB-linked SusC/RagA family outer membrane protein